MSLRIGVRELRDKLSEYLESTVPVEVTRHGKTIGFYIPIPKLPTQSERDAMLEAGCQSASKIDHPTASNFDQGVRLISCVV